jgi:hypothetical protein
VNLSAVETVAGPRARKSGRVDCLMKKTEGRKTRDTGPLNSICLWFKDIASDCRELKYVMGTKSFLLDLDCVDCHAKLPYRTYQFYTLTEVANSNIYIFSLFHNLENLLHQL